MKTFCLMVMIVGASSLPLVAQETASDSWTRSLKDRSERGTLHDAFQNVRGDTGKWRDEAGLQHTPSVEKKPPKLSLDDWADQLLESEVVIAASDENWLIFRSRQLDDNDRLWIDRIERRGNQFTVVMSEAIWHGKYFKTFTYYNVVGVNLGKVEPGTYEAKWIVQPLGFKQFEGDGRPTKQVDGGRPIDNLPNDERAVHKEPVELRVSFTVGAVSEHKDQ